MKKIILCIMIASMLLLCTGLVQATEIKEKRNFGLNDKEDYSALFWGTISLVIFLPTQLKLIINYNTTAQQIGAILTSISMGYTILFNYLEAFDIYDINGDGK